MSWIGRGNPGRWAAAWLAGAALTAAAGPPPLFEEAAGRLGLRFEHFAGACKEHYLPEIMGPGAALFDYDGDGDLDVFLAQGNRLDPKKPLGEHLNPPGGVGDLVDRLFRNDLIGPDGPGELGFTDVTAKSGLGNPGYGMGVTAGDYDGDGDLDLYVTNFGPNALYRNNGDGTFSDVTAESGTGEERWSTGAAFLDYDRDGDLDLFVLNYIDFTVAANKTCYDSVGALDYCNPNLYRPLPDRLFRNQGGGRFVDASEEAGVARAVGPGLGLVCADFNSDGWIDVYVANDGAANFLWLNQGDGGFVEEGLLSGSAYNAEGAPEGSMGVVAGDFDGDGDEDLFMSHLTMETNTLYLNDGAANFRDETGAAGLGVASLPFTGFGAGAFDFDNDGRPDLFVANGAVRNLAALRGEPYPYHQTNQLFRNLGGGRFADVSGDGGSAFSVSEVSRGAAFGDIDNDGDVDILVANNNGPARLLLNRGVAGGHWLEVALSGAGANRFGVGARVGVRTPAGWTWRRVGGDGSYLSFGDLRAHFGLGAAEGVEEVRVEWPGGRKEKWKDVRIDRVLRLVQGSGEPAS